MVRVFFFGILTGCFHSLSIIWYLKIKRDQLDGSLSVDHFFDNGYWLYQKLAEILPEDLVKRIVYIYLIKVSILKRLVETS